MVSVASSGAVIVSSVEAVVSTSGDAGFVSSATAFAGSSAVRGCEMGRRGLEMAATFSSELDVATGTASGAGASSLGGNGVAGWNEIVSTPLLCVPPGDINAKAANATAPKGTLAKNRVLATGWNWSRRRPNRLYGKRLKSL